MTKKLSEYGFYTILSTNDQMALPLNLAIDLKIGSFHNRIYRVTSCSNRGLQLARSIAYDLWSEHSVFTELCTGTSVRLQNLAKEGIVPLKIKLPGDFNSLIEFEDRIAAQIASTCAEHTHLLQGGDP